MKLDPFLLERYFAQHEFSAPHNLASSDCGGLAMGWLLERADAQTRDLWQNLRLGYTESQGLPLLRAEVARLYAPTTAPPHRLHPDQVLLSAPEEAIFIAMNCLLAPGDHVVCTFPGYQSLYQVAESLGCEVSRWEPVEEDGWRFDPRRLEELLRANTRLVICNFPHNPTGYLPPAGDWRRMVSLARERDLYLFSDEMYRWLELDPSDRLSTAAELYEKAIVLCGMSKSFGLPGLRLGWLVIQDEGLLREMAAFKDYTTICSSAPSEILSLIALRAHEEILAMHRARISRNLSRLDAFLAAHSATFSWNRPRAGTIGFLRLVTGESSLAFCERVLREAGVMLLPSSVYGYDDHHLRIGFGREDLPVALGKLDEYLQHSL